MAVTLHNKSFLNVIITTCLAIVCTGCETHDRSEIKSTSSDTSVQPTTTSGDAGESDEMHEDDEIQRLIEDIAVIEGPQRFYFTPAVNRLIEIGPPTLEPMFDVMLEDDVVKRLHAEQVIQTITENMANKPPIDEFTVDEEQKWLELWRSMGDLDATSSQDDREESIRKWRKWLATQKLDL